LRARPEPTQLEHLSDASFLGKLPVFPANVRLDWKSDCQYKHSSLFGLIDSVKGKKIITLTPVQLRLSDKSKTFYNTDASSKIDDVKWKKPMTLNDDILDAIRNRRYSLRRIDKTTLAATTSTKKFDDDSAIVAKILERRVRCQCRTYFFPVTDDAPK
jgi:hypothetical protein